MAFTVHLYDGAETGGLERVDTVGGTPSVSTSVRAGAKGKYCFSDLSGSLLYNPFAYEGSTQGTGHCLGFYVQGWSSTGNAQIFAVKVAGGSNMVRGLLSSARTSLFIYDSSGAFTGSLAFSPALTTTDWYYIELYWDTTTGNWEGFLNGVSVGSVTGNDFSSVGTDVDTITLNFKNNSVDSTESQFDDIYYGSGATSSADRLGAIDIFAVAGDGSSTTGGDALDAGSWANTQEIPANDTNTATYLRNDSTTNERLAPDTLAVQTNLTGAVTDIDDDPDSPDGLWLTASGSSVARVTFPTPTAAPSTGAGLQEFRVLMRKNATGPSGGGSQNLAPDGSVFTLTNLSGAYTDVDESPDSPDGLWLTAPGSNNATAVRASFGTPTVAPTGTQTFRAWVRKTNHSTNPTAVVELYETGGALLATVVASTTITSLTGQMLSGTFAASLLATSNGSAVEMRIAGTVGGGNPNNRASVEVGTMQWQEAYTGTETQPGYEIKLYENGSEVVAAGSATGSLTDAGGNTVVSFTWNATNLGTANGSLVECRVAQTSGADRYIEIGAIEWNAAEPLAGTALSGWVETDTGTLAGPNGLTGLGQIIAVSNYWRYKNANDGGADSIYFYGGTSGDGATLVGTYTNLSPTFLESFLIETSATLVPLATEYGLIGFGFPAANYADIICSEAIAMMVHVPVAKSFPPFNTQSRFHHLLVR